MRYCHRTRSFFGIDAGYTAAVNAWTRDGLGFRTDREYQSISGIGAQWDWRIGDRDTNSYLNVTPWLGRAMRENRGMRIFVGQGLNVPGHVGRCPPDRVLQGVIAIGDFVQHFDSVAFG